MAAFTEIDWRRLDAYAIIACGGLATLHEGQREQCHAWLAGNGYEIVTLDCRDGIGGAVSQLAALLDWEAQFGYPLRPTSRNLDALRDGFTLQVAKDGGAVLEILGSEAAWREDSRWLLGLLSIVVEHSREHLALGNRFFSLLIVPHDSPLINVVVEEIRVPAPFGEGAHTPFIFGL